MVTNISFITTHFYDFEWTELLVRNIFRFTDDTLIKEIVIVNQDRTKVSRDRLEKLGRKIRVVEYPRSEEHFKLMGHDHPVVLNRAITEVTGDYVCIFDSDAHPFSDNWMDSCQQIFKYFDAILALHPCSLLLTHPCFMFYRNIEGSLPIAFDQGLFDSGFDTGRLIGLQMTQAGQKVYLAAPQRAFCGVWGYIYLGAIYHHISGSFRGASDGRLKSQVGFSNRYFRNKVVGEGVYTISYVSKIVWKLIQKVKSTRNICDNVDTYNGLI